jgi:hypothetical protein
MGFAKRTLWTKVLAMVAILGVSAGSVDAGTPGGRKYDVHTVNGNSTDIFRVTFYGGEDAVVAINGDHDTDLDLYVYDENGNLIGSDTDGTDTCVVRFHPKWTGTFRIEVRNLGRVYNKYEIAAA